MTTELVSIIIPTFNRIHGLENAIKSALSQDYKNIELIIVNDNKKDILPQKLITQLNDPRIVFLYNQRERGANGSRNTGIINSRGKYIAFLDDDDEYLKQKISESFCFIKNNQTFEACVSNFLYEYRNNWFTSNIEKKNPTVENLLTGKLEFGFGSNLFVNRATLFDVGLWNESLYRQQDLELMVRLLKKAKMGIIPLPLIKIHGHNGMPDPTVVEKEKKKYIKIIKKDIENLPHKSKNLFLALQYRELALLFGNDGHLKKMFFYLIKSLKYKLLNPTKYVIYALIILNYYVKIDLRSYWNKLRYKIKFRKL